MAQLDMNELQGNGEVKNWNESESGVEEMGESEVSNSLQGQ